MWWGSRRSASPVLRARGEHCPSLWSANPALSTHAVLRRTRASAPRPQPMSASAAGKANQVPPPLSGSLFTVALEVALPVALVEGLAVALAARLLALAVALAEAAPPPLSCTSKTFRLSA